MNFQKRIAASFLKKMSLFASKAKSICVKSVIMIATLFALKTKLIIQCKMRTCKDSCVIVTAQTLSAVKSKLVDAHLIFS